MAEYAARVVTQLTADTTGHDTKIRTSAQVVDQSMTRIQQSATRAETTIRTSTRTIVQGFDTAAQRSRLLGYQIADVGAQLAAGTNPFLIMAQQAPQVANALDGTTGAAGRMATFLSGPWGAAMLAAGSVLLTLAFKNRETSDTVESLTRKLEENARKAELTRQAQEAFARTLPGVIERIREETQALEEQNRTLSENQQLTLDRARGNLANLEALRTRNLREQAEAQRRLIQLEAQLSGSGNDPRIAGPLRGQVEAQRAELLRLRTENARIQSEMAGAIREIRLAEVPIARREAEEIVDPIARINAQYDEMARAAEGAAEANRDLAQSLTGTLAGIERQRRAALEAERQRQRAGAPDGDLTSFTLPVRGATPGRFGERRGNRTHAGIDIAVPVGTNVGAAAAGTVIETGNLPGYGNTVIIDHGRGTVTRYAHLSQILAQRGQQVGQGDVIGLSGGARGAPGAGNSRGPHVHYEVRRNGRPVNPTTGAYPTDTVGAGRTAVAQATRRGTLESFAADPGTLGLNVGDAADAARELEAWLSLSEEDIAQLAANLPDLSTMLTTEDQQRIERFVEDLNRDLARGLAEAIIYGENLGDTLVNSLKRAAATILEQGLFDLLTGQGFGGKTGGSGFLSFVSTLSQAFGGFRAAGGPVMSGKAYVVGERGPELFAPGVSGRIIPQGRSLSAVAGAAGSRSPAPIINQTFVLDARHGITTPELLNHVNTVARREAIQAGAAAAQGTLRAVPSRMGQFQRDGR